MKKQIENRADLTLLVHTFYDRVRKDEELGPVFNSIITNWDAHLEKITYFWEQHLFGAQKYSGNPIEAHNQVDEVMNYSITARRSEEHTSELQSRPHLVCRLLLEK